MSRMTDAELEAIRRRDQELRQRSDRPWITAEIDRRALLSEVLELRHQLRGLHQLRDALRSNSVGAALIREILEDALTDNDVKIEEVSRPNLDADWERRENASSPTMDRAQAQLDWLDESLHPAERARRRDIIEPDFPEKTDPDAAAP